ncbi:MAG: prepilin-type N-terminal cleavage/methylation domain-containing protein [Candidatus Omnitrophica bacterium]|nr:prepilin-type N-terminal cleavage/methylation domain-containing protein [Candidatus Omnitrophota bacterium]
MKIKISSKIIPDEKGFTPLEKAAAFNRRLLLVESDAPQTVRERSSLTGFTLIELLVVLAILAIVMFPIYEFLRQGALSWQLGENKTEVVQNARIGLDKMCGEIKHAIEIYSITPLQIRFWWKDINADDIADADEILTFSWSGTGNDDLTRKLDSEIQPTPIANYVDDFELRYFDDSGIETAVLDAIQFITANLRIKKTVQGHDYISQMRKSIFPRNLLL